MFPFLLLSLATLSAAPATPDLGELTTRLAVTSARMAHVDKEVSKTCTQRAEQLDGDGKATRVFVETTVSEWVNGVEIKAIRSAVEDGHDVTAREQERLASAQEQDSAVQERGSYGGIDFKNPFAPSVRQAYRFSRMQPRPGDGDRVRIHFEPKGEPTSRLNTGEALVEPDGSLVSITAQPSDYPGFVSFVHFEARYANTSVGPVQTDFSVDGAGGFLFVQKHYRERVHCGDFTREDRLTRR